MSLEAVAWALRQPVQDPTAKLILISLADHHNGSTGLCCPGRALLAETGVCSEASVKRKIAYLVEHGWITVQPRFCGNGRQTSNSYTLEMAGNLGAQSEPLPPDEGVGEGLTAVSPSGGSAAEPLILEPEEEPKEARERACGALDAQVCQDPEKACPGETRTAALSASGRPGAEEQERGALVAQNPKEGQKGASSEAGSRTVRSVPASDEVLPSSVASAPLPAPEVRDRRKEIGSALKGLAASLRCNDLGRHRPMALSLVAGGRS